MKLKTSVATILFPQARGSLQGMEETLSYLSGKVNMVEFFYEGEDDPQVARLLERNNLEGIFIGVIPLKERGLDLCSLDEENRAAALGLMKESVERARDTGCHSLMLCSGRYPTNPALAAACTDAFVRSMEELSDYERQGSQRVKFLLEPCDSRMHVKHLLGPTPQVVEVARRVRAFCPSFTLTMDTAHVGEEGEDFLQSMELARPCCNHVHFANCVVNDPEDPMYGDKHVDFDHPGSAFPYRELERIFHGLEDLYREEELSIALEILCRAGEPYQNFDAIMEQMPWFFQYKG